MEKPKVLYLPTEAHTRRVFRPEDFAQLVEEFDVTVNVHDASMTTEELTLEGVRAKLNALPEPLRAKAITGILELNQYWCTFPTP